uniref:Uncharacterized protein n=1 Tax=Vannella robusta TaxID=1487602 RepID=A0A7S4I5S1_9EUKA|mmetsp:Transcript_20933/g.26481  ORF Transcript_20933/g.26481 Transcript_20933/m.26481 type:complete len:144 (+) Transcript_20933:280-711(+)
MFSHNNSLSSDLRDINLTTFVCNSLPYTDMMTESQENRGQCRKRHYKRNRKVKKSSSKLPGPDNVIESWPNDDIVIEEHDTSSTSETLVQSIGSKVFAAHKTYSLHLSIVSKLFNELSRYSGLSPREIVPEMDAELVEALEEQ